MKKAVKNTHVKVYSSNKGKTRTLEKQVKISHEQTQVCLHALDSVLIERRIQLEKISFWSHTTTEIHVEDLIDYNLQPLTL